ncbi:MAG TPA: beta-ketoacyl-ACP synthase II, partial [Chloroflexota bacterium]
LREILDGTMAERVVVTGMGAITPLGLDVTSTWKSLVEGRSGVGPITSFDASDLPTRIAAEVREFDPTNYLNPKEARRMDRVVQLGLAALKEAVHDAGLTITPEIADEVGVVMASGIGGIGTLVEQIEVMRVKGPDRVSPFLVPMMIIDLLPGHASIVTGARGPNFSIVSACATSAHCIGEAFEIIRRGDAVAVLAGGSEAGIVPIGVAGFCASRALSTRNDEPERASRPFDAQRDGFVMGEGAGVLVLESLSFARSRGARIYAEVVGYGATGDAHHITAPAEGGEGLARAIRRALQKADLGPEDVDYVNAHGTSTPHGDKMETLALKSVFGDRAVRIPVSSTKSMTGHLMGAAGAVESIVCVKAIVEGVIPPTINYEHPDPECDLDYVPNVARRQTVRVALNNSLGFGGHNCSLVFARYEG